MLMSRIHTSAIWIVLLFAAFVVGGCGGSGDPPGSSSLEVEFALPPDGSDVGANAALSVVVTAGSVESVTFSVDGTVVQTLTSPPFDWTFNPDAYDVGQHSLTVSAHADSESREATVTVVVVRDGTPPPNPGDGPMLDPGFAEPTNRIELNYDNALTTQQNGDRFETAMEALKPNDLLVVGAGTYTVSGRISVNVDGTAQNPVKVMAADGAAVLVHRPSENQNIVDFDRARYLTIQGIEWTGGSVGIRLIDVRYFFFYDNEVHHVGDAAITANSGNTSYLYFVENHIHHTNGFGEGFYLGANNGARITHHTYVVGNHIHDTSTDLQGDGVEIKDGSYACVVSDNLIENTNYPGILVYGTQGQSERNIIERNIIINSSEGGIQVAADAIVRNNLIIGADHACIVSQPHQTATPSNLTIVHNTLVNTGRGLTTSSWGGANIVFSNNVIYSSSGQEIMGAGTGNATAVGNVLLANLSAFEDLKLDGSARDATPATSSPILGAGVAAHAVVKDLHGRTRTGALDSGAVDGDQ